MKRLATILLGLMLTSCSLGYYSGSGVITTANISLQPAWGPAGYDCAHYYYFPDYNFYYDVNSALFYYLSGSRWISVKQLPYTLGYPRDLYKLYKVVLNIRDPWNYNRRHRTEYKHFCGMSNQPVLRDNRPQSRPVQNRPQQVRPQQPPQQRPNGGTAQKPSSGNVQKPQSSTGTDYRNNIRNSRNNNTSNNSVAPQQGGPSRNNASAQPSQSARPSQSTKPSQSARPSQSSQPKQNAQSTSGSRNNSKSVSSSRSSKPSQATQTKSSSSTRSSKDSYSNSSSGSRSTGSRGR